MRASFAAAALVAVALVPSAVVAEPLTCDPNPLTQGHPAWMQMPSPAVDLGAPAPASAANPLMVGAGQVPPGWGFVVPDETGGVNPLTNRF